MGFFNFDKDDFGYDRTFDLNRDGELDFYERSLEMDFYTSSNTSECDEDDEEDIEDTLALAGLDMYELEDMDEDERYEALEDAGLDPDDFDF